MKQDKPNYIASVRIVPVDQTETPGVTVSRRVYNGPQIIGQSIIWELPWMLGGSQFQTAEDLGLEVIQDAKQEGGIIIPSLEEVFRYSGAPRRCDVSANSPVELVDPVVETLNGYGLKGTVAMVGKPELSMEVQHREALALDTLERAIRETLMGGDDRETPIGQYL